jgi:hypothetical protein
MNTPTGPYVKNLGKRRAEPAPQSIASPPNLDAHQKIKSFRFFFFRKRKILLLFRRQEAKDFSNRGCGEKRAFAGEDRARRIATAT